MAARKRLSSRKRKRAAGGCFPGFWVDSLDAIVPALRALTTTVMSGHERMDWGCRVVVQDPDGRAVELNQRGHCGPQSAEPPG
jgi:hypothetical protein